MGWETLCETLGAAAGFLIVGMMTVKNESIAPAAVAVSLLTLLGVLVFLRLPETAGRELEATSNRTQSDARA